MTQITMPYVPYRLERTIRVPASRDDAWFAIATGQGITAWMLPAAIDEFVGGHTYLNVDPGGGSDSPGVVRAWDEPRYFVYEEYWGTLAGQDQSKVTPLVNEFWVDEGPDDTRVIRVLTSAFGQGDAWEKHFFDVGMEQGWGPLFEHLRLFLTHFPHERQARMFDKTVVSAEPPTDTLDRIASAVGLPAEGQHVTVRGLRGSVGLRSAAHVVVVLDGAVPGLLAFYAYPDEQGGSYVRMCANLYAEAGVAYADENGEEWRAWFADMMAALPA